LQSPRNHAGHGIVDRTDDGAIVRQHQIRDRPQPLAGVVGRDRHRLFGQIAAGANQRPRRLGQQQMMQRRVRQHHAQLRIVGGHGRSDVVGARRVRAADQQQDRGGRRLQRGGFGFGHRTAPADFVQTLGHHRQRLVLPPLAIA